MIIEKREKFRQSIRRQQLECQFKKNRVNIYQSLESFENQLSNQNYDEKIFQLAISILESENNQDQIINALLYIEKFYSQNTLLTLPSALCKNLKNNNSSILKFYIVITISNVLSIQNFDIYMLFIKEQLLETIQEVIKNFQEPEFLSELLSCIVDWPYEFFKMNTTNDQIELLKVLRQQSINNKENFYKYLNKITEEIGNEEVLTEYIIKNQIIQDSISDFQNGQLFVVNFFINLSFLESEILDQIICVKFLSAIIFELNKHNKIQQQLFMLIRNLLLSNYSIRLCFYNFTIFNHLAFGIDFCIKNFDFLTLEEILTCLKILFQEEEMQYQNHKKQLLCTDIEEMLQNIFFVFFEQKDIIKLTAEIIIMYYAYFSFNKNSQFKKQLIKIYNQYGLEQIESIISYIDQYK